MSNYHFLLFSKPLPKKWNILNICHIYFLYPYKKKWDFIFIDISKKINS